MSEYYYIADALTTTPQAQAATARTAVGGVLTQQVVPVVTAMLVAATAGVQIRLGAVRVDSVIIAGGGLCPHMTALMDSSNQPIRAHDTGLVVLVETH